MKECSKSIPRRMANINFVNKYFVGEGVDIGGLPDPLLLYMELFPKLKSVKTWDWDDGDAQFMKGVKDNTYNFVHSSHCLEHINDPFEGLKNWLRVIKPDGYIIVTIPDEDLYEQGIFPSTFNLDHKNSFTIQKQKSWSPRSINVFDLVKNLGDEAELVKLEQLNSTYRYDLPRFDQTSSPVGECAIEFIIRKRSQIEQVNMGNWQRPIKQPSNEMKIHLNQYKDDYQQMKKNNNGLPPFTNNKDIL